VFRLDEGLKVYLHRAPVDFRLSINGLSALVQHALGLDPFAACANVFSNHRRNRVKVLGGSATAFGCCSSGRRKIGSSGPATPTCPC
jgi:transposase